MNVYPIIIDNVYYCPYCGNVIHPDKYRQFICHCNDATTAREIEREAMQLEWSAQSLRKSKPTPKYATKIIVAPIEDCQPSHTEEDIPSPQV